MGSITINVIGEGCEVERERRIYFAMNRLEMAQVAHKAEKEGDKILLWYAQTKTGMRILKAFSLYELIPSASIPPITTVMCPICEGDGHNGKYYCCVCNGSGITKPGKWYKEGKTAWRPWQLEAMRKKRLEAIA